MSEQGIIVFLISSDKFRRTAPPPPSATSHLHAKVCNEGGYITWLITKASTNDTGI